VNIRLPAHPEAVAALPANFRAITAGDAQFIGERQYRLYAEALRVMAPQAPQRAPLQENRRPDPGPVMHGKSFYIRYYTCQINLIT